MSAPDASCAACMIGCVGYLPVPMISRDLNSRPAMTKGSAITNHHRRSGRQEDLISEGIPPSLLISWSPVSLSAADEVDDLDLVAGLYLRGRVEIALDDDEVAFDGDA